jgi:hypothetical protein
VALKATLLKDRQDFGVEEGGVVRSVKRRQWHEKQSGEECEGEFHGCLMMFKVKHEWSD